MDWNRAKSFTIAFLIALNLILLGINVYRQSSTSVGTARIETLTSLASKRDIHIECTLPIRHPNLSQLLENRYTYDYLQLEQLFFGSLTGIKRTDENNSSVFTRDSSTLTVGSDSFKYEDKTALANDREDAMAAAEVYIAGINASFGKFAADSVIDNEDGITITYYDTHYGYNIFSNYIIISYPAAGGLVVEGSYSTPVGTDRAPQATIASDEAVYAALDSLRAMQPSGAINITSVALGYYYPQVINTDEQEVAPYYLIRAGKYNCYVNAYNADVIY